MTGTNISVCYWWVLGIEIEFNAIFIFSHTSTSQKANKIGLSLLVLFSGNLLKNISTQSWVVYKRVDSTAYSMTSNIQTCLSKNLLHLTSF